MVMMKVARRGGKVFMYKVWSGKGLGFGKNYMTAIVWLRGNVQFHRRN